MSDLLVRRMQLTTKRLVFVVVTVIVYIYLRFYTSVSSQTKILQMSLTDLNPAILMQRNPIVIDERIVNPMNLLHTVFKFMYIYQRFKEVDESSDVFKQNKSRFLVITSKRPDCSIHILHPKAAKNITTSEELPFVNVKLHENMCMILPYNWWYRFSDGNAISSIALEDTVSLTFGKLV